MPRVLFVHNGSPGRFKFLNEAMGERGWERAHIGPPDANPLPGARNMLWKYSRGTTNGVFNLAVRAEADLIRGEAAAQLARELRDSGFNPDIIIGHPGWGEMVFLREIFPASPQIQIAELFYRAEGGDYEFDPEFRTGEFEGIMRVQSKNAIMALSYLDADRLVCPTPYQASTMPEVLRPRIEILHEGIDTAKARPVPGVKINVKNRSIDGTRPVVTFINRAFEPLRGFHVFMRALPHFLDAVPDADVLMIGIDRLKAYGASPGDGTTWKTKMLRELGDRLDRSRVHFTGKVPYDSLLKLLSMSSAHVYMTYPFVLSWSLLDAMACECLLIGSDTEPVRDVVRHGENGLLFDFFDHEGLAELLVEVCRNQQSYGHLRKAARQTVLDHYDRANVCLPAWLKLIEEVARKPA